MKIDKNIKRIIKYYLKAKNNIHNNKKYLKYLEKILLHMNKIDPQTLDNEFKTYIRSIKCYTTDNLIRVTSELLIKTSKQIGKDIFEKINEGNLNSITETEGIYNYQIFNENGLTPLHTCINMGDATILKELLKKGEKIDLVNKNGNTLLEYACLQKDPNLIVFLLNHGADMKKHLFFRNKTKFKLEINDIDTANIIKLCLLTKCDDIKSEIDINFLFNYIVPSTNIGLSGITFKNFSIFLKRLLSTLSKETSDTIINIWKEELDYNLKNKMGCPNNYLEIILLNLVPFIDYPFNLSNRNVVTNELINLINFISMKNNYLIDINFNKLLINRIWKDYDNILSYDYLGIILSNIFSKINSSGK